MPLSIPGDIDNKDVRLRIDETVDELLNPAPRSVGLHSRVPSRDHALYVCRRALEVAVHQALNQAEKVNAGNLAEEWAELGKALGTAAISIRHALKLMTRGSDAPYPSHGAASLMPVLSQRHAHDEIIQDVRKRRVAAEIDAAVLVAADELLHKLEAHAYRGERRLREGRTNPGDLEKAAFVSILVEAWMFMTGRRPGKQPERNPFLNFARRAWEDAGGNSEESFQRQIVSALDALPVDHDPAAEYYPRPFWLG